jgi:hypothetical protein
MGYPLMKKNKRCYIKALYIRRTKIDNKTENENKASVSIGPLAKNQNKAYFVVQVACL